MDSKHTNPGANSPEQKPGEPFGDRGKGDKTWSPQQAEQVISKRVGDEESGPNDDDGLPEDTRRRVPS
jgi:hypothetical protein